MLFRSLGLPSPSLALIPLLQILRAKLRRRRDIIKSDPVPRGATTFLDALGELAPARRKRRHNLARGSADRRPDLPFALLGYVEEDC